jgi:hypothetical protein
MSDIISSEDPLGGAPYEIVPHPQTALRSGARATALTTAVSLVLVGGVVAAAVRGAGHSASAEKLAPASSFAFAQIDLTLGDGQSGALSSFLAHFPDSPSKTGHGSLRDRLLGAMLRDSSDPHVDYARDVKPWLGDRAAVAGWIDAHGKPQVEFLLRSKNDAKARASLHRVDPKLGVVFSDGYAVIGQSQSLAQGAVDAARRSSLASDAHLHADLGKLSGPQVVTAWFDAARIRKALLSVTHGANPFAMIPGGAVPGLGPLGGLGSAQFKGRAVIGLHATKTYAELVMQTIDAGSQNTTLAPTAMLTRLPDGTIGAAEIATPGKAVAAAWAAVAGLLGARESVSSSFSSSAPLTMPGAYSSTLQVCPMGGSCAAMPRGSAPYQLTNRQPAIVHAVPAHTPSPAQQIEQATGLKLPGDAVTLLGSAAVFAYGGLHGQGLPNLALVTRPADVSAARALAEHSRDVIAQHTGVAAAVGATGSDLIVASTSGYESTLEAGGHLGTQSRFAAAMGTLPDQVAFAAYVDLADVLPLLAHGKPDLNHLSALGVWIGRVGDDERFQARLVVS